MLHFTNKGRNMKPEFVSQLLRNSEWPVELGEKRKKNKKK